MARPIEATGRPEAPFLSGRWLRLAAAPFFALLALRAALLGDGSALPVCSVGHATSLLDGMVPMYTLMTLVHAPPWIEAAMGCRRGNRSMR